MTPTGEGSFRLFRVAGIQVFLHWSWLLVAAYQIEARKGSYSSLGWNVAEYLALFVLVLLHEFGHALACRQVGGRAEEIVLWPLGGVAYVAPPARAGATLWSIAAGPLVNVFFVPVLTGLELYGRSMGWPQLAPDAFGLLHTVWLINLGLLIFNMLPIYPLDGGQILRSLLWFVLGPIRSLTIATTIGMIGAIGLIALALWWRSLWTGIMALFIFTNCRNAWLRAREWSRAAAAQRGAV